jgi:ParB family chromosome partitioning protein
MTNDIRDIPVSKVEPDPGQPRKTFPKDHIERLAASIRKRGLLQPISVKPLRTDRFRIVAGECRWRAHVLIKATTIRAIVLAVTERESKLLSIMENLQRRDMNPIEEANAFRALIADGFNVDQVVEELGLKSTAIVRQRIDLLDLSDDLQQLVATGNLAVNMAWGIALAPVEHQMRLLRDIQSGKLRTSEQVKHAGIALRDAVAQMDAFASLPAPSKADVAALTRLETRIEEMAAFCAEGFKDGECIAAQRVSPARVNAMADKCALIRKHVQLIEHDLRKAAIQLEIKLETAA